MRCFGVVTMLLAASTVHNKGPVIVFTAGSEVRLRSARDFSVAVDCIGTTSGHHYYLPSSGSGPIASFANGPFRQELWRKVAHCLSTR